MKTKDVFFRAVKKIVTHNEFIKIHHQTFKSKACPYQHKALLENCLTEPSDIYSDLQHPKRKAKEPPIFITARFRSGSTLLWNIFRQLKGIHSYYEPLNERMWFNKKHRQEHTDKTHIGVEDYWAEYDHIKNVDHLFSRSWANKSLLMDQGSLDSNMKNYIEALINQATDRPVLQFNRMDFRLQWLSANFSDAQIIHLYRHPRDLWISVSSKSSPIPQRHSDHDLNQYNLFYTMEWACDLSYTFPFLDPALCKHPYYYHYLLWRLSYIYGKSFSDVSIAFEDLAQHPDATLASIFKTVNVRNANITKLKGCIQQQKTAKWSSYAEDSWFQSIELECNEILNNYFQQ